MPGEAPQGERPQAVEVQHVVVDLGLVVDHHAAAVVAPVADRDLDRAQVVHAALVGDLGRERGPLLQHPPDGERVAERAEAALDVLAQRLRDPHREADARHVEEVAVVDQPEVDPPRPAGGRDRRGGQRVERDPERARKVVAGPERQDGERPADLEQRCRRSVHRPVAAAQHHEVEGRPPLAQEVAEPAPPRQRQDLGQEAARAQPLGHAAEVEVAPPAVAVRDQQHASGHGSDGRAPVAPLPRRAPVDVGRDRPKGTP